MFLTERYIWDGLSYLVCEIKHVIDIINKDGTFPAFANSKINHGHFVMLFYVVGKMMPDAAAEPSSLIVVAIANAFALSSTIYIAADASGGHVNPAVTFGLAIGGHVSIPTALFYWVAQMIAATFACLVLKVIVVGQVDYFYMFSPLLLCFYFFKSSFDIY